MTSEQFIQDAICRPDRILRVLTQSGRVGWQFLDSAAGFKVGDVDVLNQEVNFDKGRLDILATFNGRQRLVIIEVKAGIAGLEALNQLKWYLSNWKTMPLSAMRLDKVSETDVVGIALAEGFVGIPETPPNIALVAFGFNGTNWPFRIVQPSETIAQIAATEPSPPTGKISGLYSFADHRDYIQDPELRAAYDQVAHGFVARTDKRSEWVLQNVKGHHVAIHYKGEYLIHIWAKQKFFYVGYEVDQQPRWLKVDTQCLRECMRTMDTDFPMLFGAVDKRLSAIIPQDFSWRMTA